MAEQDFQIIIQNEEYSKLKRHQDENKKLVKQNNLLNEQMETLNRKVKDLTRSVYVRDSFIDYVVNECDYTFGTILNLDIVSCDITQSFYQDVVSHQQNGISSIQLRDAIQVYISKNKRIFDRLSKIQQKFRQLKYQLNQLQSKQSKKKSEVKQQHPQPPNSELKNKNKQIEKCSAELNETKKQIAVLLEQKQKLLHENQLNRSKNQMLKKQNQALSKKIQTKSEKSYTIKLLVDEYYGELEKNLQKIGGLNQNQIGTVIANEMKGIVHYINNLAKKASS